MFAYIVILGKYALILLSDRVVLMCTESCARILSADRMVLQANMCIKNCALILLLYIVILDSSALILFANIKGTRGQTGMRGFLQWIERVRFCKKNYARILFTYIVILTKYVLILFTNKEDVQIHQRVCAICIALFKGCSCTERYVMLFLAKIRGTRTCTKVCDDVYGLSKACTCEEKLCANFVNQQSGTEVHKKVCANCIALFKGYTCASWYAMVFLADIRSVSTWKKCLRMFMVSIKHTYMKKKYARILSVYIKGEQSMWCFFMRL